MPASLEPIYEGTDLPTVAASLYAAPTGARVTVTKATFINHGAASVTLTLWILPSGVVSTSDRYLIVKTRAVSPGQVLELSELRTHTLAPGDAIWAAASAVSTLAGRISAQIVT